mgnify:CR=1 FL=1
MARCTKASSYFINIVKISYLICLLLYIFKISQLSVGTIPNYLGLSLKLTKLFFIEIICIMSYQNAAKPKTVEDMSFSTKMSHFNFPYYELKRTDLLGTSRTYVTGTQHENTAT